MQKAPFSPAKAPLQTEFMRLKCLMRIKCQHTSITIESGYKWYQLSWVIYTRLWHQSSQNNSFFLLIKEWKQQDDCVDKRCRWFRFHVSRPACFVCVVHSSRRYVTAGLHTRAAREVCVPPAWNSKIHTHTCMYTFIHTHTFTEGMCIQTNMSSFIRLCTTSPISIQVEWCVTSECLHIRV